MGRYCLFLGHQPEAEAPPVRRGAPRGKGRHHVERFYLPPHGEWTKKRKQEAVKALKELYEDARETIPEQLQAGLVPAQILRRARAVHTLPPPKDVDFQALAQSLETIRVLIATLEATLQQRKKRREEEALIVNLMAAL